MSGKFFDPYSINIHSNAIINLGLKKEDTINNVKWSYLILGPLYLIIFYKFFYTLEATIYK